MNDKEVICDGQCIGGTAKGQMATETVRKKNTNFKVLRKMAQSLNFTDRKKLLQGQEKGHFMQRQKDDVRKRIAEVAKASFLDKGYQKTSMRRIAELSGVGVGNIYNYFDSKDALLRHVLNPLWSGSTPCCATITARQERT